VAGLRDARDRGVGVAIVVDRLPAESAETIVAHFGGMLAEQGLGRAPLFAVRESTLDGHGMVRRPRWRRSNSGWTPSRSAPLAAAS
jgi:hypothetical protein